jgi:hypothetical protein
LVKLIRTYKGSIGADTSESADLLSEVGISLYSVLSIAAGGITVEPEVIVSLLPIGSMTLSVHSRDEGHSNLFMDSNRALLSQLVGKEQDLGLQDAIPSLLRTVASSALSLYAP